METTDMSLLRRIPLFAQIDDGMLGQLAACARRRRVRAAVTLFLTGDPGQSLFVIVSGTVCIERQTAGGRTLYLAQRGAGEHFGEMALFDGMPRMADAVTETVCELLVLDREEFLRCLRQSPEIAVSVIAALAKRLREAADAQESMLGQDVLGRLAEALAAQIDSLPADQPKPDQGILQISYHRQELSERLGTTPESISRALTSLCDARIVEKAGRNALHVLNLPKLRERGRSHE